MVVGARLDDKEILVFPQGEALLRENCGDIHGSENYPQRRLAFRNGDYYIYGPSMFVSKNPAGISEIGGKYRKGTTIMIGSKPSISLEDYYESISKYNEKARKTLTGLSTVYHTSTMSFFTGVTDYDSEDIVGSNFLMAVYLQQFKEMALPTPTQVMKASEKNPEFFSLGDIYEMGLVLNTESDKDPKYDYLARNLFAQAKARGITATPENPARISLKGMKLEEDLNSPYGLTLALADAEVISVPALSYLNNERKFNRVDDSGAPVFENSGRRRFYSKDFGLSRLYLAGSILGSDLYCADGVRVDRGIHNRLPLVTQID